MKMPAKLFTLSEANAVIPDVRERLMMLIEKKESYARRHDELFMHELLTQAESEAGVNPDLQGLEKDIQGFESAISEFAEDIKAILRFGCLLRRKDLYCIDFPAKQGSEFIYYCWKPGELEITFYHPSQNGAEERLPLIDK
jgi:hypothetical protein